MVPGPAAGTRLGVVLPRDICIRMLVSAIDSYWGDGGDRRLN